jgi:hypothetical protein
VSGRSPAVLAAIVGAAAAIVMIATIQPLGPATNDPDSAASVLYFERIVGGQRLEAFIATTPKPLLTIVDGIAWRLTGDWRVLGWITIAIFGFAVACAARLVHRLGGLSGAAFVATSLTLSPVVAVEVSRSNSVIWAVAAWLAAGLALTSRPQRPVLAGVALLVGLLSRTETVVLIGPATLWLVWLAARGRREEARRLAPLLIGWLALPIASVHDLLLAGDPLYWLHVPAGYTALVTPDFALLRPFDLIGAIGERYAAMPLPVGLTVIGLAGLAVRRQWLPFIAIVCLTIGIATMLVVVAWRGVFVTTRYLEQIDIAVTVGAAIGVGWLAGEIVRRAGRPASDPRRAGLTALAAIVLALVATGSLAPFDRDLAAELDRVRAASSNAQAIVPALRSVLESASGPVPTPIAGPAGLSIVDPAQATLLVPRGLINRLLVDLDAPLTRVADSWLAFRRAGALASVVPGQTIYHDRAAEIRPALFVPLEIDAPVSTPRGRLIVVVADPDRGFWLLRAGPP